MKFELATLNYLLAAAETGSFRRAAAMFNVQQSSVSRAIRQLEDHLGVSLFERDYSGVRLTQAGQRFLHDAQPAIEQLEFAKRTAEAAGRAELGAVRIGLLTPLTGGFLRQLIQYHVENHPEVSIDVRDGGRREHLAAIRAHRLDIAFLSGSGPIPNCETTELWRERIHVALPKNHPLAFKSRLDWPQLKHERFIVSRAEPGPEVHDYIVRRAADYSTYPQIDQKAALQDTVMNLVSLGQGITLVSAAWTALKRPGLVLRPLTDREDIVPFSAVWSSKNDNPALRRFLSIAHVLAGRNRRGSSDWATSS
ncbi:LysR family transcriptional regulator [Sinorhizobium medicae]|nr:LysR family transcriptional regulator [Sinorhizobium medicae]